MILLIFVLKHAGLCGILGDENLRPPIFCHHIQPTFTLTIVTIIWAKRSTSTIPQNIFIYGYSLGGSSFEKLMCLDTTIVSLFFKKKFKKKKKKKKRKERLKKIEKKKKKEETYIINQ